MLFTLYNSPIHSISLNHGVSDHYYADDDQKYLFSTFFPDNFDQQRAFFALSNCIGDTDNTMRDNLIQFNDIKSDALVVYSKTSRHKPADIPISIGEASITPSESVRNLGVLLDKHLSMKKQISRVCSTAFFQLR